MGEHVGDITIRPAGPDDRDCIFALLRSAAQWLRERGVDYWQNWHDPSAQHIQWVEGGLRLGEFRIVESGGEVVGCFRLQDSDEVFWGPRPERAAYLHSFTVDREKAGSGLGAVVLGMVEAELHAADIGVLRLDCGVDVEGLRRHYESQGFAVVGEVVVDGEHLALYEKVLAAG